MEYIFYRTHEIPENLFSSFCQSFNNVFNQNKTVQYFKEKYTTTFLGYSYHAFLVTEHQKVVGACTLIPFRYHYFDTELKFALGVGVFVHENYRKDLFSLFKMYKLLKKEIVKEDISAVIAVPNDIAYPYWKKIVKWKDVGLLNYFALPIKFGNIVKKTKILNLFSRVFSYCLVYLSFLFSLLINSKEKKPPIRVKRDLSLLKKHRYVGNYTHVEEKKFSAHYTIVDEDGVNSLYLIDFYNKNLNKDARSLARTIKHIRLHEHIDLIVFVGKLNFFQFSILPIPKSKEPKPLYFTIDIFNKELITEKEAINFRNWDFGLFNYDVR